MLSADDGVNIFFGHFAWDNPSFMAIKQDQVRCHTLIAKLPDLSPHALAYNAKRLRKLRTDFVFHTIRRTLKTKGKLPEETRHLAKADRWFLVWFTGSLLRIVVTILARVLPAVSVPRSSIRSLASGMLTMSSVNVLRLLVQMLSVPILARLALATGLWSRCNGNACHSLCDDDCRCGAWHLTRPHWESG